MSLLKYCACGVGRNKENSLNALRVRKEKLDGIEISIIRKGHKIR